MKGVAHNTSAASWPTTRFFIPFSVLTGAKPVAYPASSRCALLAAALEKPENYHQSMPDSKKTARCRAKGTARGSVAGFRLTAGFHAVPASSLPPAACRG
jgi:hypothetical protein